MQRQQDKDKDIARAPEVLAAGSLPPTGIAQPAMPAPAPPQEIPRGVGIFVTILLRAEGCPRVRPPSAEAVKENAPKVLPPTLIQDLGDRVLAWYGIDGDSSATTTLGRLYTLWRLAFANAGYFLEPQATDLSAVPLPTAGSLTVLAGMYTLAEIAQTLDALGIPAPEEMERKAAEWRAAFSAPEFTIDPGAALPDAILAQLLEEDPAFAATWLRQRPEFKGKDQNLSYDREIVRHLIDHGHDPRVAVSGVIHHRCNHGLKMELREKYFQMLLSRAHRQTDGPPEFVGQRKPDAQPKHRRPQVSVSADSADQAIIEERARRAGFTVSNFVRAALGMPPLYGNRRNHDLKTELRGEHFQMLPSRRPQVSVSADSADQAIIEERALRAGLTVSNFIRAALGMPPLYAGRRDPIQLARLQDWRIEALEALGIDPKPYFVGSDIIFPEED